MSIKQIDGYKIRMNEKLGTGSYGSVYRGETDTTHKMVAIKVLSKMSSTNSYLFSRFRRVFEVGSISRNQNHAKCKKPKRRPVHRRDGK